MPTTYPPAPANHRRRVPRAFALVVALLSVIQTLVIPTGRAEAGDPNVCYVVADGGGGNGGNDLLFSVNKTTGARTTIGTGTGTNTIEAAEYDPFADRLLAADANRLGVINLTTGVWAALGPSFGTGTGTIGSLTFGDVDSLAIDPFTGAMYGVHRRGGGGNPDALFRINRSTGVYVPGAFQGGADYVLVQPQAGLEDIDDIAISAVDGQMYGIANNSVGDRLVRIDRFTGATVDVGATGPVDVEGFGADSQGTLWAVHGRTPYELYRVDPTTGAATVVHSIPTGSDHESVACLTGAPNRITGTVFHDTDGNGVLGAEAGTAGVTVTLYRDANGDGLVGAGDAPVATATTGAGGTYSFASSATGRFVVAIGTAALPAGHLLTTDNVEAADFGTSFGLTDSGNDFGWAMPATIGDIVWEDLDGDGVRDPGEPGIVGVIVGATYHGPDGILGTADDQSYSTSTGAGGAYSFTGLRPGTYTVDPVTPAGDVLTTANDPRTNSVASGGSDLAADFGYYRPATVGDRVWIDGDGDGTQDAGEVGLAGVTVTLIGAGADGTFGTGDDTTATTITADGSGALALGEYRFSGVAPGTYRIGFDLSTATGSYVLTVADVGLDVTDSDASPRGATSGTTSNFTVVSGDTITSIDAGGYEPATIGDLVFEDLDGDGIHDAGEPGIGGITVELYDGVVLVDSTTTAADGSYSFTVAPDSYEVDVDESTLPTAATLTTANEPFAVTVASGDIVDTGDFGYRLVTDLAVTKTDSDDPVADIGSFSYSVSVVNNGTIAATGVTVVDTLPAGVTYDGAGSSPSCIEAPAGTVTCTVGTVAAGATADVTIAVDVVPGTEGLITNSVTAAADQDEATPADNTDTETTRVYLPAIISDLVWYDIDQDGIVDAGEPGLADVTVELYDATGTVLLGSQVTDSAGTYVFDDLAPGDYVVRVDASTLPGGLVATYDASGPADGEALVTVTSTDVNTTTDFGYGAAGSIGDLVFDDTDGDGVLEPGETTGLAGAVLQLTWAGPDATFGTGDDLVYPTQTTGADGAYDFTGLPAGRYVVDVVTAPPGAVLTTGNDPLGVTLAAGEDHDTADFGYYLPATIGDFVWFDVDGDGLQDVGEVGMDDVDVAVYLDDGDGVFEPGGDDVIAGTATTVAGGYDVTGLAPGSYWVDVDESTLPAGTVLTTANEPQLVVLVSGDDQNGSDFGFDVFGSVVEVVYEDVNRNGVYDLGVDIPLSGVDVTFVDSEGTLQTLTTDGTGTATASVAPGTVSIDVDDATLPAGYALVAGSDPTDVAVVAGTTVTDLTGYEPQGDVVEVVFLDADGDGLVDPGEELEDVDVVFTVDGVSTTVTTDAAGSAVLAGVLAGSTVTVDVDDATLPAGSVLTVGSDPVDVVAVVNTMVTDLTGYEPQGTVVEVVFLDADGDGVLDPGEELEDVDVVFTVDGVSTTVTTDASGTATLAGVLAGATVTVEVDDATLPAGSVLTVGTDPTDVVALANSTVTDATGYEPRGTVVEVVFLDADGDGVLDPGEELAGIDVVFGVDGVPTTVTTDATGTATLSGVLAGVTVTIDVADADLPAGSVLTVGSDPTDVTVVAGSTVTDSTGYEPRGTVVEVVFLDADGDGVRDPGEELEDVDVVFTVDGFSVTSTTDATGTATLAGVLAGTVVTIDLDEATLPAGSVLTVGTDPTDVTVVAGSTVTDATGYEPQGDVAEVVFLDANGNGVLDPGEGLENVDVVFSVDGVAVTVTTDATGTATLTGVLAGATVTVEVDDTTLPAGSVLTVGTDPTDVTVVAGSTVTDSTGYEPQGAVVEVVFLDANGNGVLDAGEALENVDVVFSVDGTSTTVTTDASGTATLTGVLAGATVTVEVDDTTLPAGSVLTVGTDPTDVVAMANSTVTDSTGYEPQGAVAAVVFLDANGNGVLDPGEGLENVDVVFSVDGTSTTVTTDATGTAILTGVLAGATVTVEVDDTTLPAGSVLTVGTDPTDVTVVAGSTVTDATGYESISRIRITKSPSTQDVVSGGTATFTIEVENTGTTDLVDVLITDALVPACDASYATLAAGGVQSYSCDMSGVTADVTNVVEVTATDPFGSTLTDSGTADVIVLTPSFTVAKDPADQQVAVNGDAVFSVTIANTGETVLSNVLVDDPLATCDTTSIASLAVGASATSTCTTSGVAADFTNTVTVTAEDPIGTVHIESDTADVEVLVPAIGITKDPGTQFVVIGGIASFTITVENTGQLDLVGVTVDDPLSPDCDRVIGPLAVGETSSYSCTLAVVGADFTNEATVTASDTVGNVVAGSDTAVVDVIDPSVVIAKTPDLIAARAGDTVTFSISVTNTGDAELTNVTVSDPATPACDTTHAALAVGETATSTCSTVVTADFTNTAVVTADEPAGGTVSDSDDAVVDVIDPAISITAGPATQEVILNGTATFDITVSNAGDSALTNVVVADPQAPDCDTTIASLAVGETISYTCTLTGVAAPFTNVATVTADDLSGQQVTDTDTADVTTVSGSIEIQKTPDLQTILVGGTATFDVTVTNGGTIDLFDVTVTDAIAPGCDTVVAALAAGASATTTCMLTGVTDDVTNTAAVTAVDAVGNPYGDADTADVDVVAPSIAISATPDLQTVVTAGTATFTIEVTNNGDVDLTDVTVTDPAAPDCARVFPTLAVGATVTFSCTLSGVTADFTNVAGVIADEPSGGAVSASDTADVVVLVPAIEIQKSPDLQLVGLGGDATFTISVRNTGETDLNDVAVSDAATPDCDRTFGGLAVGESTSYTCVATGVAADFTNTATVTASDPLGNPSSDTDTANVDVVEPVVTITKTPDLQTVLAGETATFTITITNSGDVDLSDVVVDDPLAPGCNATFAVLPAGATETIGCSVTDVLADFTNVASVTADTPLGGTLAQSDDALVDVVSPGVGIQKTPDLQQILAGGDAVFTITVTNTGDQDLLGLTVSDPQVPACDAGPVDVAVGGSTVYTCTATAVGADFTNIAFVSGLDALGNPVSDSDDAAVDAIAPALSVSTTPDVQTVVTGGTATFTVEVTNTGDVTLTNVVVSDLLASGCDTTFGVLVAGATVSVSCALVDVTTDLTYTATVAADDPLGNTITGSDGGDVTVLVPSIEIQKSPDLQLVAFGDDATFTITVTNTGQTALTAVAVTDPLASACDRTIGALGIGGSTSYTCVLPGPTADLTNTALVAADDPLGNPTSDSDTAVVDVIAPALAISKTPDLQSVPVGDDATFTVTVTNVGDVTLTAVTISDPLLPSCDATFPMLAPGASASSACTTTVAGDLINTASATALDPNGEPVDGGSDSGAVVALLPDVLVELTPELQAIGVGQDATFTITVTNTGDVALVGVDVVDTLAPACDRTVGPLAPNESTSYSCTLPDVLTDVTTGVVATGVDANGNTVGSSDSAEVTVLGGAISITTTPASTTVVDGGDIVYTITIENIGPADLVDVVVGSPALPACDTTFPQLLVGESQTFTCTRTAVDASTADPVVAVTDVTASDEAGGVVADSATATVDVLVPAISIVATPQQDEVTEGGDVVIQITVANSGETPLTDVVVTAPGFPACARAIPALGPGETSASTCTITAVTSDVTGTIAVSGTDPIGATITAGTTFVVAVVPQSGSITGVVWHDADADGIVDAHEERLAGVDVSLVCAGPDGALGTADDVEVGPVTTRSPYLFEGVPAGSCRVVVDATTLPLDVRTMTSDPDGVLDGVHLVTVVGGEVVGGVDFGYVNLVPIARADAARTNAGVAVTIVVLANDEDPEGRPVAVRAIVQPANGSAELRSDGTIRYTPAAGFHGVDSFTYTLCDPAGECSIAVVTVTVNSPPAVTIRSIDVVAGQPLPSLAAVDAEGNPYTLTVVGGTLPPGVTLATDGTFTGTATASGVFAFTVRACDVLGACSDSDLTIRVAAPPGTDLAATGAGSAPVVWSALLALALGIVFVLVGRRRDHELGVPR